MQNNNNLDNYNISNNLNNNDSLSSGYSAPSPTVYHDGNAEDSSFSESDRRLMTDADPQMDLLFLHFRAAQAREIENEILTRKRRRERRERREEIENKYKKLRNDELGEKYNDIADEYAEVDLADMEFHHELKNRERRNLQWYRDQRRRARERLNEANAPGRDYRDWQEQQDREEEEYHQEEEEEEEERIKKFKRKMMKKKIKDKGKGANELNKKNFIK